MRLWRISDHADLSGRGGLRFSGRWHSRGARIAYLSDHPASTLIEVLVHLEVDPEDMPAGFQLLAVDIPDDVAFASIGADDLAPGWQADEGLTRGLGDRWLRDRQTALLRVPSAIVPFATNWLLNPAHADSAKVRIGEAFRAPFDRRLLRRT